MEIFTLQFKQPEHNLTYPSRTPETQYIVIKLKFGKFPYGYIVFSQ